MGKVEICLEGNNCLIASAYPYTVQNTRNEEVMRGGRGMSLDQEKAAPDRHLVSWRSRIREQQLADNRRLNESIRSSLARDACSMSPLTKRRYFRASPSPSAPLSNKSVSVGNLNEQTRKQLEQHDNR